MFQTLDLIPSPGEGSETPTLFGPSGRACVNNRKVRIT
jgi:hypothetical protein